MRIAVEGCCHGELDKIYETVLELEKQQRFKIDLLIICGDFQAVRNFDDLQAMAVPPKYQHLNTFYKYYSKEKVAPVLTVFIGGNHEASSYMQELPYGGWVAQNIYYMGYASVIQIGGLRIGGISGIFKGHDYNKGHFEKPPYEESTKRSVYHVRNLEVFRLKQISRPVDIFISHDWPRGVYRHGDVAKLVKRKPFFKKEIEDNSLGSGPLSDLLTHLQPSYWFAAHLHVKFAAHIQHQPKSKAEPGKCTKFLALDKCLPHRSFLQVLEIPHDQREGLKIKLDPEWLTILQNTDHLLNLTPSTKYMPGPGSGMRFDFRVTDAEIEDTLRTFGDDLTLPENFVQTSPPVMGDPAQKPRPKSQPLFVQVNPQTTLLCSMLNITDPNAKFMGKTSQELLDESSFVKDRDDLEEDDSGEDAVYDDDDDDIPSTIDSSMDVSTTAELSNVSSSKWDSFQTANETLDSPSESHMKSFPVVTSTPARGELFGNSPLSLEVDDNDEEFLAIMSAKKNNTCGKPSQFCSSPSLPVTHINSPVRSHPENVIDSCDLRLSSSISRDTVSGGGDSLQNVSSHLSDQDKSTCHHPVPLKAERTSLGMSGLSLDPRELSASLTSQESVSSSKRRESTEHCESPGALGSGDVGEVGSGAKKLKRRNVSLYSQPQE